MLDNSVKIVNKNGLNYIYKHGKIVKYTSWMGDAFAGSYDKIMERNVFPGLFGADFFQHRTILKNLYRDYEKMNVLELGAGSGNTAELLNSTNYYTGVDISKRLLKKAKAKFFDAGFMYAEFFVCSADDIVFKQNTFDVCICNLSLNFFPQPQKVIKQLSNILKPKGKFICCVPLADRACEGRVIRGTQFSIQSVKKLMSENEFSFDAVEDNGALIYFVCSNNKKNI